MLGFLSVSFVAADQEDKSRTSREARWSNWLAVEKSYLFRVTILVSWIS